MALEGRLAVQVGAAVEFVYAVSNAGTEPVELRFASGKIADVAVYEAEEEIWRWSDGRAFTQALGTQTLLPGESFTHEATWTDPVPGEFEAVASLGASNASAEARTSFDV